MEITLQEIDEAIFFLRTRAAEQARDLVTLGVNPYTNELRPAHAHLMQRIYRMACIRNGLIAEKQGGEYLQ